MAFSWGEVLAQFFLCMRTWLQLTYGIKCRPGNMLMLLLFAVERWSISQPPEAEAFIRPSAKPLANLTARPTVMFGVYI